VTLDCRSSGAPVERAPAIPARAGKESPSTRAEGVLMTSRSVLRRVRISGLVVGVLLCAIAVLAIPLGLGEATDFVFFRWWGMPRKTTFYLGGILMLASLAPNPRFLLAKFPASGFVADFKEEFISEARPRRASDLLGTLIGQLLLAALVAIGAFFLNRYNILSYIDGHYLLTLNQNQAEFTAGQFGFSTNPLQGLGDIWFFTNTRWLPELALSRLFSDPGWQAVTAQCLAFGELFAVTFWLAYWLYRSTAKAVASAWLAVLMIMPLSCPPLIYDILADAPEHATLITLPLIVVMLWAGVGQGVVWADAIRVCLIGLILWVHFIALGLFTALTYPFVLVASAVFTAAAWPDRREFRRKIVWGLLLIVGLLVSGLPKVLFGIIWDSAFELYPQHVMLPPHELPDGSLLLRFGEPFGVVIAVMGVIGAFYHVRFGRGRPRTFAIAVLLFVSLLLAASLIYTALGGVAARPIYYEYVLWPVYPIFAVPLLAGLWHLPRRRLASILPHSALPFRRWPWLILPVAAVLILHGPNHFAGVRKSRPNIFPPRPTLISEYLRVHAGLVAGAPFKGRVVTMTGQGLPPRASWERMFELDMRLLRAVGNDHRTIGMWYFGIPTLIEFSHTIPPFLYAIAQRYLAYEGDTHMRYLLNMRLPSIHVLRLLGVRFIVTDSAQPTAGARRRIEMPVPDGNAILAVDEIADPNLGVSPTSTFVLKSAEQALDWIGSADSDFAETAVLEGSDPGLLVRAEDVTILVERDGLRVRAKSRGRSLLVIPFSFSHCLRASANSGGAATALRRADLALTGVLFDRELDVTIQYRQGPFQQTGCRLEDLADDRRLIEAH
jgi:hypothetical protein